MDYNNLLQRCETLEDDFNALGDYFEKRDFVDRFLNDVMQFYPEEVNGNKTKINKRRDAYNKAKELFKKEFKIIEPELMLQVAEKLIIELFENDFENDYKELNKYAKLIRLRPHKAYDRFYDKDEKPIFSNKINCKKLYYEVYVKYKTQNEFEANNVEFRDSLSDETFFNEYQINNEALAANLLSYTASILSNELTPTTTTELPTGGNEIDDVGNSKTENQQATEYDLLKKLKTISHILIWLKITFDKNDDNEPQRLSEREKTS